jgi:hypothetical protein
MRLLRHYSALVPNLMLSWQQAVLLAIGLGAAGMLLTHVGRAAAGGFLREAGVVAALYALWQLVGNLASGGTEDALDNAWWIWRAERAAHLPSELAVEHLLLPHPLLSQIVNVYYATMHFGVLIAVLIWMFIWHRDRYPALRNTMAASTAICLLISFIPVAPPRMLPSLGFVDLPAKYGQSVYATLGLGADQLSAMPSVHAAWAVLVAWAVITSGISRWRWLIAAHPLVTVFVIVGARRGVTLSALPPVIDEKGTRGS